MKQLKSDKDNRFRLHSKYTVLMVKYNIEKAKNLRLRQENHRLQKEIDDDSWVRELARLLGVSVYCVLVICALIAVVVLGMDKLDKAISGDKNSEKVITDDQQKITSALNKVKNNVYYGGFKNITR